MISKGAKPRFRAGAGVVARKGDRATHFRSNGVAHTHLVNVERIKRQRVEQLEDRDGLSSWNPFEDDEGWEDVVGEVDSVTTLPEHTPRRRNASDDPMLQWIPHISSFLDDLLRRSSGASRRQFNLRQLRRTLHGLVPLRPMRPVSPMRELRLPSAYTAGEFVSWWNGSYWAKCSLYRDPTARKGDAPRVPARAPRLQMPAARGSSPDASRDIGSGILKVDVRFCNCSASLQYRLGHMSQLLANHWYPATVVCNVNATDFMHALARTTNAAFKDRVPVTARSRWAACRGNTTFFCCSSAGRGHVTDGFSSTPPGGLAVRCWACPDPERNLPPGWEKEPDQYVDRLKEEQKKLTTDSAPMNGAPTPLRAAEHDVSTCIAFAALMQKETRLTKGLRVSGVGGYANMDWVFMSAVGGSKVKRLVVSYDIACQWKQHLRERVKKISAPEITTRLADYAIDFALPVWHAAAHGEGIERTWAILNPVSYSTKEMSEGHRHDAIEEKVGHINFRKNIGQGDTLARKMIIAIKERDRQCAQSTRSTRRRGIPTSRLETAGGCLERGQDPNAALLARWQARYVDRGTSKVFEGKMTMVAFIKAGLQLEDLQRRIETEVKSTSTLTAERSSQLTELRNGFYKKLQTWETHQEARREERDGEAPPPLAENVKLWLPSRLTAAELSAVCPRALVVTELRLREGQCGDAISKLRGYLHSKTHLVDHRNANAVGQALSTRYGNLINRVTAHIDREFNKYNRARSAGLALDSDFDPKSESDARARAALGRLGSAKRARNEPSLNRGTGPISWIWFVGGEGDQKELHDSVRVQWTKALARRDRWTEEVVILREEMRTSATQRGRRGAGLGEQAGTSDRAWMRSWRRDYGRMLCGRQQCVAIGAAFRSRWSTSAAEGVRSVVNGGVDDDEDGEEEQEAIQ
ncbi:CxC2 domain-containing protein [Mycena chlorophos]|uniref:CxC2 domain-containing protein n=1 Tax=Mycena chlorophos TaxID=658473 RepID=A0A8H6W205_MYCCL|nr:CxC2 domain-containing protein [Mycena chlorophos]